MDPAALMHLAAAIEDLADDDVMSDAWRLHGHEAAEAVVRDLRPQLDFDLLDATRVLQAATIKADHAMAYADAFAAATALAHQAPPAHR